jgi:pimeloyl-ACP methyl ester carboxylesterase
MDGTGYLFRNQVEGLADNFDLRAVSIPADNLSSWQGLVEQVADLLGAEQSQSPSRSVYLCGESFGGCLALKLVTHAPHLCDRLILVNPASSFSRQPWMRWAAHTAQWMPNPLYQISTLGLLPFLVVQNRVSDSNRQQLLQAMQSVRPESAAWRLSLLSQFALPKLALHQLTQPVLVITSAADQLLPSQIEGERLVQQLPNARKIVLSQSGHACLLETDVKLHEILRSQNFLEPSQAATRVPSPQG